MKLSPAEKLLILMLCDLSKTDPMRRELNFDLIESSVMNGYNWAIPFEYEWIGKSDYPIEIFSILESWHRIEISFEKLVPADLKKIETDYDPIKFDGFDGNLETEQYFLVKFIIEKLNLFEMFKNRSLNSHSRRLSYYRAISAAENLEFHQFRDGYNYSTLNQIFQQAKGL
jgi:uncharacterized protein YfbU (UPF0304 family)